ncbi:Lecithin:cholesterol acyltransferase family protein [Tritrichomonas foetus]|uniref:Lecithin:cholesterol acyltransferase family protein n=1 Tax=Tritrichomonas foetus TaxID=1144522 RepID=A0A1J4KYK6_9EUKA|nr:Lecithin:cholesterol acyltransferase family protein [Tritrichomonas foetus]|eukprot:OHT16345.1 Lecithin:cholesterol acyltransferase family protein [Tritrichomonas foetus]
MFVFLFCIMIKSLKPVLILPGLYGSNLVATASHYSQYWFCPQELDHEIFWLNDKYLIPPFHNCLFELLQCHYDEETDRITSQPGVHVDVVDFGGSKGLDYIDHGLGDIHAIESFGNILKVLQRRGYKMYKDLFGVPFDWRLTVVGLQDFFPRLQRLIEKAYRINKNQKVTLVGCSCGGFVTHYFLTQVVDEEWKNKYVEKVVLIAPAISGSAYSLFTAWKLTLPIVPFLKSEGARLSVQKIPVIHSMFPNFEVFQDIPVVYGPNDQKIYPKDIPKFLFDHQKLINTSYAILNKTIPIISKAPEEIGLPVYLMYNDGYDTPSALNMSVEFNEEPESIFMPGDTTLTAYGQTYPCRNWSQKYPLVCHNFHMKEYHFIHAPIFQNDYVADLLFNVTNNEDWIKTPGKREIIGPHVEIDDYGKYNERNDIREKVENPLP